ncbi:peptidoglycan-binding protein [Devosia riboflavina]|uniref:peptidoglycan-binding protein n=1 Tax=Devosia riboflavina TaxID=46914 RepID=UPI00136443AD|nr:peptidoglycan-binding protein [Devosia riboflavina]
MTVLTLLPIAPTQSQDFFQTLITIMNENAPVTPGSRLPIVRASETDPGVLEVQRRLANLGYDVGVPDGVMGPRTRQAIANYQQSIGTMPTGTLTSAERSALLGGSAPAAQTPIAMAPLDQAGFDLLHDVDLPGNDFRSGMSDPALKGIVLDGCMAACAADAQCQAFTYNASARVCFLKSAATNPSAYGGAISGMRKAGGSFSQTPSTIAALAAGRPLSPAEVAQLQAGLSKRGYDAGVPDGVAGGKTRAAIARFLADNPGQASHEINVALMQAVLGQSAVPSPPVAIDASQYRTLEEADRDFALIALAKDPSILDQSGVLQTWFSRDARSADFGDNFALITAYDNGNAVERETILANYRQTLLDEAKAFVADPANLKFHIRITNPVQFDAFEPGQGLLIRLGSSDVLEDKRLLYRTVVIGKVFGGLTLDAPDIRAIPVADKAAAAALIDRVEAQSGNRLGNITVWLTISEVGIDRNAQSSPLAADIAMTVAVDKVALMTFGRDGRSLGEELEVLYLPSDMRAPQLTPTDNLLVAQALSLPLIEGHLVMPGSRGNGSSIGYALGASPQYEENLGRFLNLASIRLNPDRAGEWIEEPATRVLMNQGQHLRVYGQTVNEFSRFANEFDRRRAMAVYTGEVVPELVAAAPTLPVNVVSVSIAQLGDYDFATQSFPIAYPDGQLFDLPGNLGQLRASPRYFDLPTSVAVDEASAEAMVRAAAYGQPVIYIATFGTLALPPTGAVIANPNGLDDPLLGAMVFSPLRAGIFADPALQQSLAALDPAVVVNDPDGPRLPPPPSATELALNDIVVSNELELLALAYDRLAPQGLAASIIESAEAVRNANEFDIALKREEVEQLLKDASRRPVWLKGVITFGTYSTETGRFDVAEINLQTPEDSGFAANYHYSLSDPRQLANLAIPADAAKTIVETASRQTAVLAQVNLVDISSDANPQTPTYRIALDIGEMLVLTADDGSGRRPELIARLRPDTTEGSAATQVASAPPLRQLDPEALDYLRIKYAPETMDDAAYERMMSARWAMEQTKWVPEEEFFFPLGTDLVSAGVRERWLPDFKLWTQARLPSLDGPLRLACASVINGENWPSPLHDPMLVKLPDLGAAVPIDRIAARYASPHLTGPVYFEIPGYLMEAEVCGNGVAPYPLIEALGLKADVRSGALIRIEDVVMPGTGGAGNGVELDLVVDSVEVMPHPEGGKPMLLIRTRFDSAWYPGDPPVAATTAADLEALTAANSAQGGSDIPEGWDIVGLQPGQSLEEADAIIRDHMEVAAVYERQQGQRQPPYFSNEISYLDATLSEAITLIYEPTRAGDIVFLIAREVGKPADTMPTEDILAGLRKKYGAENLADQGMPGQFFIRWHSQETPGSSRGMSDVQHCGVPSVGAQGYWTPVEGSVEAMDPNIAGNIQVRGYMVLPAPSDINSELLELGQLDCGVSIMANKHKTGNNDSLMIQMFDYAGYARAFAEAQELAESAKAEGDASEEAAPLDIEL